MSEAEKRLADALENLMGFGINGTMESQMAQDDAKSALAQYTASLTTPSFGPLAAADLGTWEGNAAGDDVVAQLVPHLAARFLCWKLPSDFCPDAGISFAPDYNNGTPQGGRHEPTGTNLLNAEQAFALVRHLLDHPAVRAALPQAADGWRPIESAPKDGTRVLVWMEPVPDPRYIPSDGPMAVIANYVVWSDAMKREGMSDGWSWYGPVRCKPTHWQPLPPAPAQKATGK